VVVDVDFVAGQHAGNAEVAGIAFPVAEQHVADTADAVQLSTGGLAAGDSHASTEPIAVRQVVDLERHRDGSHVCSEPILGAFRRRVLTASSRLAALADPKDHATPKSVKWECCAPRFSIA
jgi:hypothetical protein